MLRHPGLVGSRVLDEVPHDPAGTPDQTDRLTPHQRALRTALALEAPSTGGWLVTVAIVFLVLCITPVTALFETPRSTDGPEARMVLYAVVGSSVAMFVALFIYSLVRRRRLLARRMARLAEVTAWPARQPFEVTGFASWLVADRPLLDLHLTGPIDQAKLGRALQNIDAAIQLAPLDERTMRITLPAPRAHHGIRFRFGNFPLLERVFGELLVPLHADGAVARVTMGGLLD